MGKTWLHNRGYYLVRNLVAGLLYLVVAFIISRIVTTPNIAVPLWPPAGVAMVAGLLYSWRILPGLWLGILGSWWISQNPAQDEGWALQISLYGLLSIGAIAQVMLGAFLGRRYLTRMSGEINRPLVLTRFLLTCGPVCAVVSASYSVAWMVGLGWPVTHGWWPMWLSWWFGDTVGILAFLPCAVILANRQSERRWLRACGVGMVSAIILVSLALVYQVIWRQGAETQQQQMLAQSKVLARSIEEKLSHSLHDLAMLAHIYEAQPALNPRAFNELGERMQAYHSSLQAFNWITWVPGEERGRWETRRRSQGEPDFRIQQLSPSGRLVEAPPS